METTKIGRVDDTNEGSSDFTIHGRIIGLTEYSAVDPKTKGVEKRDALKVVQLSGVLAGREIVVVLKPNSNPAVTGLDAPGLTAKKIYPPRLNNEGVETRPGATISLVDARYLGAKNSEDGAPVVMEARRIIKIGEDFDPKKSIFLTAYRGSVNDVRPSAITLEKGDHIDLSENKLDAVKRLVGSVVDKLSDSEGILIGFLGMSNEKPLFIQHVLSRLEMFTEEGKKPRYENMSTDKFKLKVDEFLATGKLMNVEGSLQIGIDKVLSGSSFKAIAVPTDSIRISKPDYLTALGTDNLKGAAITAGLGSVGLAISKKTADRDFDIVTPGTLESVGLRGFVHKKGQHIGKNLIPQSDEFIFYRLLNQINTFTDRPRVSYGNAASSVDEQPNLNDVSPATTAAKADAGAAQKTKSNDVSDEQAKAADAPRHVQDESTAFDFVEDGEPDPFADIEEDHQGQGQG